IRRSSAANSPASSPPAPARISRMTSRSSFGSFGSRRILTFSSSCAMRACAGQEEFTGKEGQQLALHTHGKIASERLLVLGLGNRADTDRMRDALRTAAARAVKAARSAGARSLGLVWPQAERIQTADGAGDI